MGKRLLLLTAVLLPQLLGAQTGVVKRYPAHAAGKDLTMEEAVLGRGVLPVNLYAAWYDAETVRFYQDGKWMLQAPDGTVRPYAPVPLPEGFPQEVENITEGPDGSLAYTVGKSLFIHGDDPACVAQDDDPQITFGQTVSRNEFGIDGGIFWSPDGRKLAFYRKDESRVTEFPLLDITTRTGTLRNIKYPMNGMASEIVRLGIYDRATHRTVYADVRDFDDERYLPGVSWSPDGKYVFIQVLDRAQKHVHLNMYRAADGTFVRTLLTEANDRYVEPLDPVRFLKGSGSLFLYRTDNRDGYRNIYLCDTLGGIRRLTPEDADAEYAGNDGTHVWYTSAAVSPVENHLFRIAVKPGKAGRNAGDPLRKAVIGKPVRLTREEGWHEISLNADCTRFIDTYSSFSVPTVTKVCQADGKEIRTLSRAEDPLAGYRTGEAMLGTVKSADGKYDNWYRLFLPPGFDPAKKYPVILYVYGGPHSQMVRDSWMGQVRMWEMLMAQKGYIVYVQDNRGTSNRGAAYEKEIHGRCGQCEMEDQMAGIDMLRALPFVDADRIGVHGWSYGGFMTISLMTRHPETFKVGVAGGPVIDWKWYEVMYGERYMETEKTNPEGFAKTSLINRAKDLKGRLLICQGAIDNTVVWEHSLSFVQKCIEEGVQLDYFPYPCSEHNVFGRWRIHLMDKVTAYFDENL